MRETELTLSLTAPMRYVHISFNIFFYCTCESSVSFLTMYMYIRVVSMYWFCAVRVAVCYVVVFPTCTFSSRAVP